MNKLMGFYEMKTIDIPTIEWKPFTCETSLDDKVLWTIRTAVVSGNDINLPVLLGAKSIEAYNFGLELLSKFNEIGMVLYHPFFISKIAGNMQISKSSVLLEIVKGNLTSLNRNNNIDLSYEQNEMGINIRGNKELLTQEEIDKLLIYADKIKRKYRSDLVANEIFQLEWSYAFDSDIDKRPIGKEYIIFYEMRNI